MPSPLLICSDGRRVQPTSQCGWRISVVEQDGRLFGRMRKRQELVNVQALGPEAAVERLDECFDRRLAGPAEVKGDALRLCVLLRS